MTPSNLIAPFDLVTEEFHNQVKKWSDAGHVEIEIAAEQDATANS